MTAFNKFGFISDLELEISIEKPQDINQFIYEQIDNACIYYSDCFEICQALNVTSFETEYGFAKNITELASYSLSEFVFDHIAINS